MRKLRRLSLNPALECNIFLLCRGQMLMDIAFENHPPDDVIELYALGRLSEGLIPSFEEHLLICSRCQDALQSEDVFSQSMTEALKRSRTWG